MFSMRQKAHQPINHYNPVILKAIKIAGGTTTSLAEKAQISQNAVWKLLRGKSKCAKHKTAVRLEQAVNGAISRYEFMTPSLSISANTEQTEIEKTEIA
jgi:plasmid maintenance system antidote protein VapI